MAKHFDFSDKSVTDYDMSSSTVVGTVVFFFYGFTSIRPIYIFILAIYGPRTYKFWKIQFKS